MKTLNLINWQEGLDFALVLIWISISLISGSILSTTLNSLPITPQLQVYAQPLSISVVAALGAIVWCLFRLFEPQQFGTKWAVTRFFIIVTIWLSLIIILNVFFGYLGQQGNPPPIQME
jgi:small basic protein